MDKLFTYLPLLICGGSTAVLWKCVKEVERLSKAEFKRNLASIIVTAPFLTVIARLPEFCVNAFEAIFTGNLWSIRGFIRSCIASLFVVSVLFGLWYWSIPSAWHLRVSALKSSQLPSSTTWFLVALHGNTMDINPGEASREGNRSVIQAMNLHRLDVFFWFPFLYNFLADFAALIVTRATLEQLSSRPNLTLRHLVISFALLSALLFALSYVFLHGAVRIADHIISALSPLPVAAPSQGGDISDFSNFLRAVFFPFYKHQENEWNTNTLYGVFVWSTLMGVLWVGVFGVSIIIANFSIKLRRAGPWLDANFHVRREPYRILALLVMIPVFVFCMIYHAWML